MTKSKALLAIFAWLWTSVTMAATLLPPGRQVFVDGSGVPLAGGYVYFYVQGTTTPKVTWMDSGQTEPNPNPIQLDSSGSATIYGSGTYREIVTNNVGGLIWDQPTADTSSSGLVFAGNSTGTANLQVITAPSFTFANGQELSFIAGATNTGPLQVTVNGTAYGVDKDTVSGPIALSGGEVHTGNVIVLVYDTTLGAFHILVPITSQTFTPLAAAPTSDLGTSTSVNVTLTGSGVSVASFGTSALLTNPLYTVVFGGANTLVNSAALALPGGQNILTQSGDSLVAQYLGTGNWAVLQYNRAGQTVTQSVTQFGASGSKQNTVATIAAGSLTATVSSPIDFRVGQGVRFLGAGAPFTAQGVSIGGTTIVGTGGATTYSYYFCSFDVNGGLGPRTGVTVANGPDPITYGGIAYYGSTQNYVQVNVTQGAGSVGYLVYRGINGAAPSLYTVSYGPTFKDQGIGWQSGTTWSGPGYWPTSAPTVAQNDWLVTSITAISGNTFTLANAAGSTTTLTFFGHSDTAAFNAAAQANLARGSVTEVPCGSYEIDGSIIINSNYSGFIGQGQCSILDIYGTATVFSLANTNVSAQQRFNFLKNLYIPAYNQSAGFIVYGTNLFEFTLENVIVDTAPGGFYFLNVNTINMRDIDLFNGPRGHATIGLEIASDASNGSCCLNAYNVYIHGNAQYVGGPTSIGGNEKVGYEFDGNVATVYAWGMAISDIEGVSFNILNDTGNAQSPYYITCVTCSSEFSTAQAVNLAGPVSGSGPSDIEFIGSTITSAQNNNPNVVADSTTARLTFTGGKSTNAGCRGFDISGNQTLITAMLIGNNSTPSAGGTAGACDGIAVESVARNTTIVGNSIGDPFNPTVQNNPVRIASGGDYFTITGNTFFGNVTNCPANGAGTGTSRVIGNNAGSC